MIAIALTAACGGPDGAAIDAADGAPDAAIDAGSVDAPAAAAHWPRTADELRRGLGERGRWTAAWQLDELAGDVAEGFGPAIPLVPRGSPRHGDPGAWPGDRALGFDGADDGVEGAWPASFVLGPGRSLAVLVSVRAEPGALGGLIASKRDPVTGRGFALSVEPGSGHLLAELGDGTRTHTAVLPIDHRDGTFHDVVLALDGRDRRLRLLSDLGRSEVVSTADLDGLDTTAPFALGATADRAAAIARLTYVAIALDDVAALVDDGDDGLYALRLTTDRDPPTVRPPAGIPWVPPWPIRRERHGHYSIAVDPHGLRLPTTAELWIGPGGDDAAAGTMAAPKRSLHAALSAMTEATTIHVAAGTYDADAGWYGVAPAHDVNVIAEGGRARLTAAKLGLPWQASPAGAGVYVATPLAPPYTVIDTVAVGDPWLVQKATVAEVAATADTWTYLAGEVTVHLADDRAPDATVAVMPRATLNGMVDDASRSIYLEGLDLEGGYKALYVRNARELIAVDCSFRYGAGEGLSVNNTGEVLLFGAVAEANDWDGIAYTAAAQMLEVDCAGSDNGRDGSNIDNGSTSHGLGTVIRIGGSYRDNLGPNVADVLGSWSWDLGTVAGGNRATDSGQRVNFYGDNQLWLHEATAADGADDRTVDLSSGLAGSVHAFDTAYVTEAGTGTIDGRGE